MTQALNLANFANNLNTSGATSNAGLQNSSVTVTAGTGMSGGGSVALGSSVTLTNAGVTSFNGSTGAVTFAGGTVSSIATGNGLSGGTITTTGTLTIAAPSFNSVGSYAMVIFEATTNPSSGSNYSAGTGGSQLQSVCINYTYNQRTITNNLSGTWKWMGGPDGQSYTQNGAIAVRVS